jgi:hypothetical protein
MEQKTFDKLKDKYCKIVTKEPGNEKSTVLNGFLRELDHDKKFIMIESEGGPVIISIDTLIAIKPSKKNDTN